MADNEKGSSKGEGRLLLVLGVVAFIVALGLIVLAVSAFRASLPSTNQAQTLRGHGKVMSPKP